MLHELKCWPQQFQAIVEGRKGHEVRRNDRDYRVGDELTLREWEPMHTEAQQHVTTEGCEPGFARVEYGKTRVLSGRYTGRRAGVKVLYITPAGTFGLPADVCVMTIQWLHDTNVLLDLKGQPA